MKRIQTFLWTIVLLIVIDLGINAATTYPPTPMRLSELGTFQRYFNYGRSVESKVRWMTADRDDHASALARSGWLFRPQDRRERPAEGRDLLVSFYGMSFSDRVGRQLESIDDKISVRLSAGPGATIGRSYADFMLDRGHHEASVVVLGILASTVSATNTVTHMTWNFEAPGSHFYPKFHVNGSDLIRLEPPVNSLKEFRAVLNDDVAWQGLVEFMAEHDPYYDSWSFGSDGLDRSIVGRLIRRAYAQMKQRQESSRYHDAAGFTDYGQSITVTRRIIEAFASRAVGDGHFPVVLLFNDRGFDDHLYQAVHERMDELEIAYVSSHEVVRGDELAKFESDGHFRPEFDREIARRLLGLIRSKYTELGRKNRGLGTDDEILARPLTPESFVSGPG